MKNLLDQVLITPAVYQQWLQLAHEAARKLPRPIDPLGIGDEDAELGPDGTLVIFGTYQGVRMCEMVVSAAHWTWRYPPN